MTKGSGRADEAFRLLGLARRAGSVAPGTDAARRAARGGEARLILMACDASTVQAEKVLRIIKNRPIPWGILGDRASLGVAVGRGPVSAVAVTAESFAGALQRLLETRVGATPDIAEEER
jgi:ribosomal protein L7Ae-like RNA K-turn-binding protein